MNDSESGLEGAEFVVKLFRRGDGDVGIQDVRRGGVPPTTFPGDVHVSAITSLVLNIEGIPAAMMWWC